MTQNIKNIREFQEITRYLKAIPREKAFYITGFVDGEGSFNISFRKRDDYLIGWKITPVFNISQKEEQILAIIKHHLNCGTLRFRKDGVWVYEVENKNAIQTQIIPFFKKFSFLSQKKKKDFVRFQKIVSILESHKSTSLSDLVNILTLLDEIESKNSRKFTNTEILERASEFWAKNKEKIELKNL
jgi:hypothetical protein